VVDPCDHGNEFLGSIEGGEFVDCLLASQGLCSM
jgi:hypothetical protein